MSDGCVAKSVGWLVPRERCRLEQKHNPHVCMVILALSGYGRLDAPIQWEPAESFMSGPERAA